MKSLCCVIVLAAAAAAIGQTVTTPPIGTNQTFSPRSTITRIDTNTVITAAGAAHLYNSMTNAGILFGGGASAGTTNYINTVAQNTTNWASQSFGASNWIVSFSTTAVSNIVTAPFLDSVLGYTPAPSNLVWASFLSREDWAGWSNANQSLILNAAQRLQSNTFGPPQTFASNIIVGASLIGTNTYTERLYTNVIANGATNIIPNGATNWTQGQGYVIQMTNDADHVIIGLNTLFSTEASGQNLIYVGDVEHVNTISYAVSDTELRVTDTVPEGSGQWVFYWGQIYDLTNVYDLTNIVSGYATNAFQLKFGTFGEFGTQTVAFAPTPLAASVLETMGYNLPITNVIGGQAVTLTLTNRTLILGDDVVARRDSTNLFTDRQTLGYPTNTLGGLVVLTNLHEAVVTENTNWVSGTGSIDYNGSISAHILGSNTLFMSEISPGDRLRKNGVVLNGQVSVVISDVELYMTGYGDPSGYESFDIGEVSVQTNYVEIANSAGVVVGDTGTQTVAFANTTYAYEIVAAMGFSTGSVVQITGGTNIVIENTGTNSIAIHTSGDVVTNNMAGLTLSNLTVNGGVMNAVTVLPAYAPPLSSTNIASMTVPLIPGHCAYRLTYWGNVDNSSRAYVKFRVNGESTATHRTDVYFNGWNVETATGSDTGFYAGHIEPTNKTCYVSTAYIIIHTNGVRYVSSEVYASMAASVNRVYWGQSRYEPASTVFTNLIIYLSAGTFWTNVTVRLDPM